MSGFAPEIPEKAGGARQRGQPRVMTGWGASLEREPEMTPRSAQGQTGKTARAEPAAPPLSLDLSPDISRRVPRTTLFVQTLIAASIPQEVTTIMAFALRLLARRLSSLK